MKYYIVAQIKKGKLIYNVEDMRAILSNLKESSYIQITISNLSEAKSKEQLGYFFGGIVNDAAEHFGWEEEEMYQWLISECNKQAVVNKFTGEINYVAFGLSHCDKGGISAVIEKAIRLLAEHGFVVQTPEEYLLNEEKIKKPLIIGSVAETFVDSKL